MSSNKDVAEVQSSAELSLTAQSSYQHIKIGDKSQAHLGNNYIAERAETPPTPSSNVPFPQDPDYVERTELIEEIRQKIARPGNRAALVGLGGVGKSQLAIAYAHEVRQRSQEKWVFWIYASSAARFDQSVRTLVEELKIPGWKDDKTNWFVLLRGWLRGNKSGEWLIVLDNADDASFLTKKLEGGDANVDGGRSSSPLEPRLDYLPHCTHGSVLVTSRTQIAAKKIVDPGAVVHVVPMGIDASCQLIKKKLGSHDGQSRIPELADALGHIPLAMA